MAQAVMDAEPQLSTKERIDAAALALFVRAGVDAATTREIAMGAGVSEGAIYRHYRSKDALATALFMGAHRRLSQLVEEAAAGERDINAKAAAIVARLLPGGRRELAPFHLPHAVDPPLPALLPGGRPRPGDGGREALEVGHARSEIPPADPRVLAAMVIGLIVQTAQNKAYGRFDEPLERPRTADDRRGAGDAVRPLILSKETEIPRPIRSLPSRSPTGSCRSSTPRPPRLRRCSPGRAAVAAVLSLYTRRMLWAMHWSPASRSTSTARSGCRRARSLSPPSTTPGATAS